MLELRELLHFVVVVPRGFGGGGKVRVMVVAPNLDPLGSDHLQNQTEQYARLLFARNLCANLSARKNEYKKERTHSFT
jgi:hypothetical protein